MDSFNKISNQIINDFNFEVYLGNGTQLENLSICYNNLVYMSTPIINQNLAHLNEAKIFNSQGYNIYNLSSEFYTEKCSPAYINGNDITIKDRLKDIYPQNITFCPKRCKLDSVEINYERLNCYCDISFIEKNFDLNLTEENLTVVSEENFFVYLLDMLNYKIFGCSHILAKSNAYDY